ALHLLRVRRRRIFRAVSPGARPTAQGALCRIRLRARRQTTHHQQRQDRLSEPGGPPMTFAELLQMRQYSLSQPRKEELLVPQFNELTEYHRQHCPAYARLLSVIYHGSPSAWGLAEIPFLPVELFKTHRLSSVPDEQVFKTVTSSGTSGQQVSQITLD